LHITELVKIDNIAAELDQDILDKIGSRVIEEYEIDIASMKKWTERNDLTHKLIDPDPEEKSEPWPGAANTKMPLILNAAMKVSAEEFAEIIRGKDLVKYEMYGIETPEKLKRAQRVVKRMNFQYRHEMDDWEDDHDRLVLTKNLLGVVHKKYFFSPEKGHCECVLRLDGVVVNNNCLKDPPRITDEIEKFWWEVEEKVRAEQWIEVDLSPTETAEFAKTDQVNEFLEQIRREDLDEDGYPEPYVVTVHKRTRKVVRITPNYAPESIKFDRELEETPEEEWGSLKVIRVDDSRARVKYIKYEMIPDYKGGYWGWGFGILLGALTDNANTLVNQLLDAGTMSNTGGGFRSQSLRMESGEVTIGPGEWIPVNAPGGDISRSFYPLPTPPPSQTLFQLLGLIMETVRELSSVTEVVSGTQSEANMPASSVAMLLEQGKKAFGAIYKRHRRSLSKEFLALFDLNFLYEDPTAYLNFHDLQGKMDPKLAQPLIQGDYEREGLDIYPTANAEFSTKTQRIGEAQSLKQMLMGSPNANQAMIDRMLVSALLDDEDKAAELVPDQPNMTPEMAMQEMQVKLEEFKGTTEARMLEAKAKESEIRLQIAELEAQLMLEKMPMELKRQELLGETAEAKTVTAVAIADRTIKESKNGTR